MKTEHEDTVLFFEKSADLEAFLKNLAPLPLTEFETEMMEARQEMVQALTMAFGVP